MSIFISLRCEKRGEGRSEFSGTRCWSDDNEDPWVMADDSVKSARECLPGLFKDAKSGGWKHIRGVGWVCPNCLAHMAEQAEGE